jgi:hypothetical protein
MAQPDRIYPMDALTETLTRSPELFPYALAPRTDSVSFIGLSEADYRRASFLDGRILTPQTLARTLPWRQIQAAAADLPETCDFIFHIGHVGSTLLSRLLGAHPQILSLREPQILRDLARTLGEAGCAEVDARLPTFLKLWSRSFRAEQRPLIKATSFASELAAGILARPSHPKAIFLFVPAQTYLATILGGPNSRQEAQALGPSRLARLRHRLGTDQLSVASEGEGIAMSWACEMTALRAVSPKPVHWLNFDRFLAEPQSALAACFAHLGIATSDEQLHQILAGPDMRTYSKAQEYDYDANLRADVLDQARAEHRAEIRRGMAWLERTAKEFPAIEEVLKLN